MNFVFIQNDNFLITDLFQLSEKVGEHNNVAVVIEECGGLDKIEELQSHPKDQIYNKAYHIVETYFSESVRFMPSFFKFPFVRFRSLIYSC